MKKLILFLVVFVNACLVSAQHKVHRNSISRTSNNGEEKTVIINDNFYLEIKEADGIQLNEEETMIKAIPAGGYVKYKNNGKKLIISVNAAGEIVYEINGGEKKSTLNTTEKAFVAAAIKEMIAYGIGAKDRATRIYAKGGFSALVKEIEELKSDYVRGLYFETMLHEKKLSPDEVKQVLPKISSLIESDYEKGKLLKAVSIDNLSDAQTTQAYFNAVKSIESDYEKANAIKSFLKNKLTEEQFTQALEVTKTIESDYEKANVLKQILSLSPSGNRFDQALSIVNSVESDFEKAGVLKKLIDKGRFEDGGFDQLLASIGFIDSDFEKSNVYKKLLDKEINTDDQWIAIMKGIEKVDSDFEKGSVLLQVAKKMPSTEKVRNTFMAVAKTIDSDYEYGRLMKAIR